MATHQATALVSLLGKTVTVSEILMGCSYERRGVVIGVLHGLPGSGCSDAFLLDQGGGRLDYYDPLEVTVTVIV